MSNETNDGVFTLTPLIIGVFTAVTIMIIMVAAVDMMHETRKIAEIQARVEAKKLEGLRPAIRAELDNTFVELPDGSRIYLQSSQEQKR